MLQYNAFPHQPLTWCFDIRIVNAQTTDTALSNEHSHIKSTIRCFSLSRMHTGDFIQPILEFREQMNKTMN